jgi:radical SAM modification target selenobiotic family peptide
MEMNQLKKMLAGLSIASLIASSGLGVSGCANGKSA